MPSATPVRSIMRSAARYFSEPHPFARAPTTMPSHPISMSVYTSRLGRSAAFVLPALGGFLAWPFAAEAFFRKTGV
ncbi:hypothetical protein GQ43DRAFT_437090 [Delitschia confertaspora ATCC 74209]|uniref:Uncharacterized protein n=1 Tax=Delitschia confertaspora ATCC 74209 TaxID=1513339 RepID=A0A9P4JY60_9PLEO|nr:hypothetical protein GQ43DRAFT_437090 [Delitschia confertaspora ATCC 74209]